jgi:hypothetical protein
MSGIEAIATVPVAKNKAFIKSGKRKGKLRRGCRIKGKRALCTPEVAKSLGASRGRKKARGRKKGKGKHPCASANPPAWCNKGKKGKSPSRGGAHTPFSLAMAARKSFKSARTCQDKADAVKVLQKLHEAGGPVFATEVNKKLVQARDFCVKKQGAANRAQSAATVRWLDGLAGRVRRAR